MTMTAKPTTPPTEYRILALYRFVPLVTLPENDNANNYGNTNDASSSSSTAGAEVAASASHLMAHPERHPTLRALQSELQTTLKKHEVKGTLLIAPEGINGTICYPWWNNNREEEGGDEEEENDPVANYLKTHPLFGGPELRTRMSVWKDEDDDGDDDQQLLASSNEAQNQQQQQQQHPPPTTQEVPKKQPQNAFHRLKIKIKAEIVTLGLGRPLVDRKPVLLPSAADTTSVSTPSPTNNCSDMESNYSNPAHSQQQSQTENNITSGNNANGNTPSDPSAGTPATPTKSITTATATAATIRHTSNQLANPLSTKGTYLNPTQWDEACRNPNILVIDTRNTYEIEIGTFENAVDPKTENFSDFPQYLERLAEEFDWDGAANNAGGNDGSNGNKENMEGADVAVSNNNETDRDTTQIIATQATNNKIPTAAQATNKQEKKKKKLPPEGIAMFCTGGIRCEKATSYAIQSNLFPKNLPIYHLEGGILAYLDDVAKREDKEADKEAEDEDQEEEEHAQNNNRVAGGEVDAGGSCSEGRKDDGGMLQQENDGKVVQKHPPPSLSSASKSSMSSSSKSSTFHGECFVFDKRVAVTNGLKPSKKFVSCHGCRGPMDHRLLLNNNSNNNDIGNNNNNINNKEDDHDNENNINKNDKEDAIQQYQILSAGISHNLPPLQYDPSTRKHYLPGLTCPRCHASTKRESLERFAQRERQMEICARVGKSHFQDRG